MGTTKENLFTLQPINFKEMKHDSNFDIKQVKTSEFEDKYDPLLFCRTCANMDPCLVPIFKEEGLGYSLNTKIEKYLPIEVSEEDELPVHLCYHCASTLIAWDSLIVGCIEAEKKLNLLRCSAGTQQFEDIQKSGEVQTDKGVSEEQIGQKKAAPDGKGKKQSKVKSNEKRDILQEKNEFNTPLETDTTGTERPNIRRNEVSPQVKKTTTSREENLKYKRVTCAKCGKKVLHSTKRHLKLFCCSRMAKSLASPCIVAKKCPQCLKIYNEPNDFLQDLYSHVVNVQVNKRTNNSNICRVCYSTCNTRDSLVEHVISHVNSVILEGNSLNEQDKKRKRETGENVTWRRNCEICGKTISRKYAMIRHMVTHTGEKKFTCHHCGKQYSQESGLQRHLSVKIQMSNLLNCIWYQFRVEITSRYTYTDHFSVISAGAPLSDRTPLSSRKIPSHGQRDETMVQTLPSVLL
ncbi:hypothetical protein RUM44_000620 [Polyplax serrata]|uniref:Uncharacterized protein n=1 Tax=Polyplax serrata TaxID=468196 RepID=A0ABR1B609_POLSC